MNEGVIDKMELVFWRDLESGVLIFYFGLKHELIQVVSSYRMKAIKNVKIAPIGFLTFLHAFSFEDYEEVIHFRLISLSTNSC